METVNLTRHAEHTPPHFISTKSKIRASQSTALPPAIWPVWTPPTAPRDPALGALLTHKAPSTRALGMLLPGTTPRQCRGEEDSMLKTMENTTDDNRCTNQSPNNPSNSYRPCRVNTVMSSKGNDQHSRINEKFEYLLFYETPNILYCNITM